MFVNVNYIVLLYLPYRCQNDIEQRNVVQKGTKKSIITPWKIEITAYSCPEYRVIIANVVSSVVAPPTEIGDNLPKYRTNSGVHSNVITSRRIFDNKAIVPSSGPLYSVMNILDSE